ncbi:hypothetical protein Fcan01_04450 [Folsomia candida]|uniref:Uncharacterized protein n=2 Tax=Folsomia candida TaxID=158441 RepID=A0A226EN53_FOLCA|nr:hypothetical protein Fcan01_04450 [Folsomia candida]
MFSTQISPSLLEPLLLPMQAYIIQMYHLRTKFPTMLKSYYNCLSVDIQNHSSLVKQELPNVLDILPLFNLKIFAEFISLLVTNPWSKINVICPTKVVNSALAIFKICYMIKNFKRRFPPPPTSSPQRRTSSQQYNSTSASSCNNPENSSSDSGYFSCSTLHSTTVKSTSVCDEEEEDEELICDSRSNKSSTNSFVEQEEPNRNKFYLGDEEDDEQTESKFALSEPMKEKLFPNAPLPKPVIKVQQVPLQLSSPTEVMGRTDQYSKDIYYLNNSTRFSPFQTYQLFHAAPNYDYIHTVTNEILEINLNKLMLRSINLKATPPEPSKKAIRELVSKTRSLCKLITDSEKSLFFFLVNLVEIIK